jgi:hypothetical protein
MKCTNILKGMIARGRRRGLRIGMFQMDFISPWPLMWSDMAGDADKDDKKHYKLRLAFEMAFER